MKLPNPMEDLFLEFSELVTGHRDLSPVLAKTYYLLLCESTQNKIEIALRTFDKLKATGSQDLEGKVKSTLTTDETFRVSVQKLLTLWYLGKLPEWKEPTFDPVYHYEALIWKTGHAHAPGISGGYYGYWHYKPEN